MKKLFVIWIIVALGMVSIAQAGGQRHHDQGSQRDQGSQSGQSGQSQSQSSMGGQGDQQFYTQASQGGQFEVQLGQLGQERATDQQVKELAQHLARDHQQVNQQLQSIAQQNQMQTSTQIPSDKQQRLDRLRSLSGSQFDQAFVQEVIQSHQNAIQLFQRQAQQGTDQQTKQFAQNTVPKLQQHLQMAQQCQSQIQQGQQGQQGSSQWGGSQQQGSSQQGQQGQQGSSQWRGSQQGQQGQQGQYGQQGSSQQGSSSQQGRY